MKKERISALCTPKTIFIIMLVLQLMIMFYWGNVKEGYFVDELWSYGLANSYYHPHIFSDEAMENDWLGAEYFKTYIEVEEGERFTFGSVVYNMANDAHPPMYFFILHAICSFFPGTFSKWYGIVPNMVYFLLSQILLRRLSGKLFKSKWLALLPCIVWGFSPAAVSFVIFIRMYMLSTMCGLLTLNLHMDLMEEKKNRPVLMWFLVFSVSFFGYMCHYFYFIFAFFVSAFYMLYLLVQKNWKRMIWYTSAMGGSLLLTAVAFPMAFIQVFGNIGSTGGTGASVNQGTSGNLLYKLYKYVELAGRDLFAADMKIVYIVSVAAIVGVVLLVCKIIKEAAFRKEEKVSIWFFFMCAGASAMYYFLAVKMAPSYSNRYICVLYPLVYLMIIWLAHAVWRKRKHANIGGAVVISAILAVIAIFAQNTCVDFLGKGGEKNESLVAPYMEGADVYFISFNFYKVTEKILELEHAERVRVTAPEDWRLKRVLAEHDTNKDHLIIYIDPSEGMTEEIIEWVLEYTEYTECRPIEEYTLLYDAAMAYLVY